MADLQLWTWVKYAPAIGDNRTRPDDERFFLRLKAGISKARHKRFMEGTAKTAPELLEELKDLVELGEVPLRLLAEGAEPKDIATLQDYLDVLFEQRNGELLNELIGALVWHNSVQGARAKNSERLAGGDGSTLFGLGETKQAASSVAHPGNGIKAG